MKRYIFPILLILLYFSMVSCSGNRQTEKAPQNAILMEVTSLTDKKSQRAFLEKIGTSDQAVREQETAINQKYGYDSKEHKEAIQIMIETDKSNLEKIEAYILKHGYPNKIDHDNKAFYAPWIVMHLSLIHI